MRMENSPEYEARMEAYRKKAERERKAGDTEYAKARDAFVEAGRTWMPMDKCPFEALDKRYELDGAILVTDGTKKALAVVHRRFGTLVFWKVAPDMVFRDGMMCYVGGERDPRPDLPEWWWKWELTDQFGSMTYAGGEETGKEEVDFVPTMWLFLPDPPKTGTQEATVAQKALKRSKKSG